MKDKTIYVTISELKNGEWNLTVSTSLWLGGNIIEFINIHTEEFKTMDEATKKLTEVHYEYEQRMDNLTGGNDE